MTKLKRLILTEADLIILALSTGGKKISELRPITGLSLSSIYNNVRKLLETKLIFEEKSGNPPIRMLRLTERGKQLSEKLIEIEKVLEQDVEPKKREYEIVPE